MGVTGFGVFFILFGILLYFDSVLLAFGNVSPPILGAFAGWPGESVPSSFRSWLFRVDEDGVGGKGGTTVGSVGMENLR